MNHSAAMSQPFVPKFRYGGRTIPKVVVKEVWPMWQAVLFWTAIVLTSAALFVGSMYGLTMRVQHTAVLEENIKLKAENEKLLGERERKTVDKTSTEWLRGENARLQGEETRLKGVIQAEVVRKKELAIIADRAQQLCTPTQRSKIAAEAKKATVASPDKPQ